MALTTLDDISTKRLYLQVAEKVRDLILEGSLLPGERLPSERSLSEQFSVSRPTVREAIIALEIMGLVSVKPSSGVYVMNPSEDINNSVLQENSPGPFEILEARLLFEADAVRLASERISNDELQQLRHFLTSMQHAINEQDPGSAERADQKFHLIIADATRNSAISSVIRWLWTLRNKSEISHHFHQHLRDSGNCPILDDHQEILDALMQRDADAAEKAVKQHLTRVITELTERSLT